MQFLHRGNATQGDISYRVFGSHGRSTSLSLVPSAESCIAKQRDACLYESTTLLDHPAWAWFDTSLGLRVDHQASNRLFFEHRPPCLKVGQNTSDSNDPKITWARGQGLGRLALLLVRLKDAKREKSMLDLHDLSKRGGSIEQWLKLPIVFSFHLLAWEPGHLRKDEGRRRHC